MNDPQEPGRAPGEDGPEQPPLIPPPRSAADDRPPPARRARGVPPPRDGDASHTAPRRPSPDTAPRSPDAADRQSDGSGAQPPASGREAEPAPAGPAHPGGEDRWTDPRWGDERWTDALPESAAGRERSAAWEAARRSDPPPEGPRDGTHGRSHGEPPGETPEMTAGSPRGEAPDGPHDETQDDGTGEPGPAPEATPRPEAAGPTGLPRPGGVPGPARAPGSTTGSGPAGRTGPPVRPGAPVRPPRGGLDHAVLKSLLGAWALAACSAQETAAVEAHLTDCAPCADEALRLRDAVALLHPEDSLDLDPRLRARVLEGAMGRRPPRIPIPGWAAPYDAETARLDALLRDMAEAEWRAPVRLRWFDGEQEQGRTATVAEVISHLLAVDGLVAGALGLPDPLAGLGGGPAGGRTADLSDPTRRTEAYWRSPEGHNSRTVHGPWREQTHALVRGASFADPEAAVGGTVAGMRLPLRDALLDRAFECWVHAGDIAEAVDYPHPPPQSGHLHQLVELAARMLPYVLAGRRRAGLAPPARRLAVAGAPGRTLHLEVEGSGGGDWYVPLDSPDATGGAEGAVAHVALDGVEFCQLVAGHVSPRDAAAGAEGDPAAIRDVLYATASMSRL